MAIWRKIIEPHAFIITVLTILFIWIFQFFFFSRHFLDPFNNGLRDYEITDIVYSRFRNAQSVQPVTDIVLINTGLPDRETLAGLLDRISRLEPRVVGLDIELNGLGRPRNGFPCSRNPSIRSPCGAGQPSDILQLPQRPF